VAPLLDEELLQLVADRRTGGLLARPAAVRRRRRRRGTAERGDALRAARQVAPAAHSTLRVEAQHQAGSAPQLPQLLTLQGHIGHSFPDSACRPRRQQQKKKQPQQGSEAASQAGVVVVLATHPHSHDA
jgi:hypothetical protein